MAADCSRRSSSRTRSRRWNSGRERRWSATEHVRAVISLRLQGYRGRHTPAKIEHDHKAHLLDQEQMIEIGFSGIRIAEALRLEAAEIPGTGSEHLSLNLDLH